MATNAVPGFLPSRHGFRFPNIWPKAAARSWNLGLFQVGIGDVSRGLCGGMVHAARNRFARADVALMDAAAAAGAVAPAPGTPLFREIVDRQFDSFGVLWAAVPLRFWLAALRGERGRVRETVLRAWPGIRGEIDKGDLAMIGLVRNATANPLALDLGHQVVGYRYEVSPERVAIGVYDPNHPGDDSVEVGFEQAPDGAVRLWQSTGEPLLGLLQLP